MSGNEAERWEAFKRKYAEWEYNYTIAKKMKEENIAIDLIIKVTGLSKEEIENL